MRRPRTSTRAAAGALALALAGGLAALGCGAPSTPASEAAVPRCPGDRAVVLTRQIDVARIAGCAELRGITIRTGAALDLSALAALTTLAGDLTVGPTLAIHDLTLPALREVRGAIRVAANGLMQGVFLPRLERAGAIAIDGNVAITTVSLPRLTTSGRLAITENPSLELIDVSALVAVDQALVVVGSPQLTLVEAGKLTRVGQVELDAAKLPPELVARLHAATGSAR